MIDESGYRANVAMVIINQQGLVLLGERKQNTQYKLQFPQGGVLAGESVEDAMWRELYEEVGLKAADAKIVTRTKSWLYYQLPSYLSRNSSKGFIGQKQIWFLLNLTNVAKINLATSSKPEFVKYHWTTYWYPINQVIKFKQKTYRLALSELSKNALRFGV